MAYNMACCYACLSEEVLAVTWFKRSIDRGLAEIAGIFVIKVMDFVLKMMDFMLKCDGLAGLNPKKDPDLRSLSKNLNFHEAVYGLQERKDLSAAQAGPGITIHRRLSLTSGSGSGAGAVAGSFEVEGRQAHRVPH